MSSDGESVEDPDDGDLLPDEKELIAERLDELEDTESHLTTEEVAESLGLDLD